MRDIESGAAAATAANDTQAEKEDEDEEEAKVMTATATATARRSATAVAAGKPIVSQALRPLNQQALAAKFFPHTREFRKQLEIQTQRAYVERRAARERGKAALKLHGDFSALDGKLARKNTYMKKVRTFIRRRSIVDYMSNMAAVSDAQAAARGRLVPQVTAAYEARRSTWGFDDDAVANGSSSTAAAATSTPVGDSSSPSRSPSPLAWRGSDCSSPTSRASSPSHSRHGSATTTSMLTASPLLPSTSATATMDGPISRQDIDAFHVQEQHRVRQLNEAKSVHLRLHSRMSRSEAATIQGIDVVKKTKKKAQYDDDNLDDSNVLSQRPMNARQSHDLAHVAAQRLRQTHASMQADEQASSSSSNNKSSSNAHVSSASMATLGAVAIRAAKVVARHRARTAMRQGSAVGVLSGTADMVSDAMTQMAPTSRSRARRMSWVGALAQAGVQGLVADSVAQTSGYAAAAAAAAAASADFAAGGSAGGKKKQKKKKKADTTSHHAPAHYQRKRRGSLVELFMQQADHHVKTNSLLVNSSNSGAPAHDDDGDGHNDTDDDVAAAAQ
jgi:hypothetical protein